MAALSSEQKQQIQTALAARRDQLSQEIRSELMRSGHEHFADLAGEVPDVGEASVADMLVDQEFAIVSRQMDELSQVVAAQKRLSEALYGECDECGAEIGLQRLLAVPHATRCIACQGQHEKMFAHESTPKL